MEQLKYFKKPDNSARGFSLHALALDGSQDHRITPDMVPISDAELAALDAPTLATRRANALKQIDADTDALIGAVIGNRSSEYERAETEGAAYAAAGYAGTVPPSVSSWATAKGWTAAQAADSIIATSAAWRSAQEAIRAQRLLRKEQARTAVDAAAIEAVLAEWAGFLLAIRGQLGV